MRGSLTAGLVSYLGIMAMGWGDAAVLAVPAPQNVAQVTTLTGIDRPTLRAGTQGVAVSELQAALKLLGYYTGEVDGVYNESTVIAVSRFQQAAGLNPDGVVSQGTWALLFPLTPPTASSQATPTNSAAAFPVPSTTRTTPTAAKPSTNNTNATNSKPASASAQRSRSAATTSANNTRVNSTRPAPASTSRRSNGTRSTSRSNGSSRNAVRSNVTRTTSRSNVSPNRPSTSGELPVLRVGAQGTAVTKLQQRLQAVGLFNSAVDGDFGPETEAAVKVVQQRYGLEADGVVGPSTWNAINRPRRTTRTTRNR